jgi:hypothetical protein
MRNWLMLAAALLTWIATASGHEVSLGGNLFSTSGLALALPSRPGVELAYAYEHDSLRFGGGVRWSPTELGNPPLEVYARALLTARLGVWRPSVGPELGLSGIAVVAPARDGYPADYRDSRAERIGPAYIGLHATPLRFAFSRFTVSALELQWGTHLVPEPGSLLRLQVGLLHVGVVL